MVFYPFYEGLQNALQGTAKGNYGLWYNKFIPLNSETDCKPSDERGDKNNNVDYYCRKYRDWTHGNNTVTGLLKQKHDDQDKYCESFPPDDYEVININATLLSPLVTGIGESHPHEVSMVFDHNMGIPYIPASGVKGIVRFAHTLSIFLDENGKVKEPYKDQEYLDETKEDIPDIFGGEKKIADQEKEKKTILRGRVIFLDAYPAKIPDLHIDIMNPHYGEYYKDGKTPPADHLSPVPLKFLTVANGTSFIFRAVAEKKENLPEKVRTAYIRALTKEGVGAKTAIGYGRLTIKDADVKKNSTSKIQLEQSLLAASREEIWNEAYVSFNAGGGGVVTAKAKDGKKAELRGKDKVQAVTTESLHKKIFEGKKCVPKARITVRKTGNSYEIIRVEPVIS